MMVGLERKKEEEETKEVNKEVHGEEAGVAAAADPPETILSIVKDSSIIKVVTRGNGKVRKVVSLEITRLWNSSRTLVWWAWRVSVTHE